VKHRAKQPMTPEQQQVINRLMAGAIKVWDTDLIRGAAESGAQTQELLAKAIVKKSPDMVRLALQYGAEVNALVPAGGGKFQPVLHYAHENFDEPVFTLILAQGVSIDLKNPQGETVVQRAARAGDFERMRFYLAKGADLAGNAQEVLVKAIEKKDLAAIQWSIEHGADVQGRVTSGESVTTLLHLACNNFREDIAEYLLNKGVPVEARNSAGETPLHLAARQLDAKRVEFLLQKGANPLTTSYAGVSVLDEVMKNIAERDSYDREYGYSASSSFSGASGKNKEAKGVLALLLAKVKEVHGLEPYNTAVQRDITVQKPIAVSGGKSRDEQGPPKPE
jgi:hypothetical protein